jgi:hypothetical protein
MCGCPMESADEPSGLHLYEGTGGLAPGGTPARIHGVRALVRQDASSATLTVTFPAIDQWITIGPAPTSTSPSVTKAQVAEERRILASIRPAPAGGGTT